VRRKKAQLIVRQPSQPGGVQFVGHPWRIVVRDDTSPSAIPGVLLPAVRVTERPAPAFVIWPANWFRSAHHLALAVQRSTSTPLALCSLSLRSTLSFDPR